MAAQSTETPGADTSATSTQETAEPIAQLGSMSLKTYCERLTKTIARYLTNEELQVLAATLEQVARNVTETRYCPGLVDAAYDLLANATNMRKEG